MYKIYKQYSKNHNYLICGLGIFINIDFSLLFYLISWQIMFFLNFDSAFDGISLILLVILLKI